MGKLTVKEDAIQIAIVEFLSMMSEKYGFVFFSVPNEAAMKGRKGKALYALIRWLKKMGMMPGASDLVIGWRSRMFCMEVKTDQGKMSVKQRLFRDWVETAQIPYRVVRSVEEAALAMRSWGILK